MTIILTGREPVTRMYVGQSRLISATHLSLSGMTRRKRISRFGARVATARNSERLRNTLPPEAPKMSAEATQKNIPKK
jgi:hypothetical protein